MKTTTLLATLLILITATFSVAQKQPNIVFLFADDAGYADFGFQGSKVYKTPNLDNLAKGGVIFDQMYVTASVCGPSRAGLLTGRYQQRYGFIENNVPGIMDDNSKFLGDEMGVPTNVKTMGEYLQERGYKTAIFGKWHLGEADKYHPTKRGFDEFVGFRGGARSFFPYTDEQKKDPHNKNVGKGRWLERGFENFEEHEGYLTNVLADEACDFIERHKDERFFAFVSFNAVHLPLQIDPQDKDTYPELEGVRRQNAQMTLSLDRACGQIIDKLEALGLTENTIIVFSNDNGGPSDKNASNNFPFAGVKGTQLEGGIRVPGFMVWPGKIKPNTRFEKSVMTFDLLPTFYTAAGGNASNIKNIDGVDILPYINGGKSGDLHEYMYWKWETRGVVRNGNWKLMRFPDRPAMLFNTKQDPGEQKDLSAKYPERVNKMFKELFAWEMQLERPMFMLRTAEEQWSANRFDQFRKPPAKVN
ncbi:sulfatase-like hydrolase/transferase [Flammeovirga kamogawensis]|uniref:Sulfatase-like hydrolase/transferase n=1 Tax=Flammeovirga kamogawensis TaxID=373891 RepID=A0ABX8H3Q9_9BACT|nr:sulfatase-like hydrolase/transferase [Flammeovirga kamogawensis]MBB6461953.1 arylsulfatase A-like enzyme [Flammeovirga kamogawensis]QWG10440.1 sulfatase-like hydrolase/transferase [Flammeovirga kamogawensis]TRX63950.1 sulfatase-like hydrolase/transferase [Flammeovirga kamogawensis]